jgi:6-phosphogluconolactonase
MPSPAAKLGEWRILETAEAVAEHAAEWLCMLACACEREFAICLSGGSTPRRLYQHLAGDRIASRFPWNSGDWFWGDERFVPHDHPDSNYRMIYDALFARVPAPKERIHAIPTEGVTPDQAAAGYQTMLQRYYGVERLDANRPLFDVTLLGIGENGHIASLFPGSAALREKHRWVLAVVGETPETRITLTYPTLESSHNVVFLVVGANKKEILARIRAGDKDIPAAKIRPVGNLFWFVDKDAASG